MALVPLFWFLTLIEPNLFIPCSQAEAASPNMAAPANGSGGGAPQSNGKNIFTVTDSVDQPRLKGQGRLKRTRISIRRHLQKHGLASADSDSDLEDEESECSYWLLLFIKVRAPRRRIPFEMIGVIIKNYRYYYEYHYSPYVLCSLMNFKMMHMIFLSGLFCCLKTNKIA